MDPFKGQWNLMIDGHTEEKAEKLSWILITAVRAFKTWK